MTRASSDRIDYVSSIPFFAMHAACLLAFWTGVSWFAFGVCLLIYWARVFAITAGLHRLMAHSAYRTSRAFQFLLALVATMSVQKGPLWWASLHRHHHAHSDEKDDVHSPVQGGFWWSHAGWILCHKWDATQWKLIPDLARYGELRWLNRYHMVPGAALAASMYVLGAWLERAAPGLHTSGGQLLVWGFFLSTVMLYHATFMINSLAHVVGSRRYATRDDSRNNWFLALFTMGEGWHNNHHFAPSSERLGFFWWEIDVAHYILTALSWVGVVWDLKRPPARAYEEAARAKAA